MCPDREGTLAHRFGDVGFGVDVVPGKRVGAASGGARRGEPGKGVEFQVLVKTMARIKPGSPLG